MGLSINKMTVVYKVEIQYVLVKKKGRGNGRYDLYCKLYYNISFLKVTESVIVTVMVVDDFQSIWHEANRIGNDDL
jgi:hypothetical protein